MVLARHGQGAFFLCSFSASGKPLHGPFYGFADWNGFVKCTEPFTAYAMHGAVYGRFHRLFSMYDVVYGPMHGAVYAFRSKPMHEVVYTHFQKPMHEVVYDFFRVFMAGRNRS